MVKEYKDGSYSIQISFLWWYFLTSFSTVYNILSIYRTHWKTYSYVIINGEPKAQRQSLPDKVLQLTSHGVPPQSASEGTAVQVLVRRNQGEDVLENLDRKVRHSAARRRTRASTRTRLVSRREGRLPGTGTVIHDRGGILENRHLPHNEDMKDMLTKEKKKLRNDELLNHDLKNQSYHSIP